MRYSRQYQPEDSNAFLLQLVSFGDQQVHFSLLYSGGNISNNTIKNDISWIAAIGADSIFKPEQNAFDELALYLTRSADWLFGCLAYDLKNETEKLTSNNIDHLGFPNMMFVQPKAVLICRNGNIDIEYVSGYNVNALLTNILKCDVRTDSSSIGLMLRNKVSREQYIEKVNGLIEEIQQGNIYEINYCQEFYSPDALINPSQLFLQSIEKYPTPFSCLVKQSQHYIISASPERFLKKEGKKIYSQPIKGTARRGINGTDDERIKLELRKNKKERSENIMIVDLVRNDLSKIAKKGTVEVNELCEIYSYPNVHQMISTISAEIDPQQSSAHILKSCFPMGSMTGAPKVSAMKLIEKYESTKRGVYSGAVGYFNPNGDFDFNVIIRSLLYNKEKKYLSLTVGSAITNKSIPEKEYEECLLKAHNFLALLNKKEVSTGD